MSLTWALTPGGFHAEVTKTQLARELGSSYVFRGRAMPLVTVLVRDQHVTVHVTRSSSLPASLRLASSKDDRDSRCRHRMRPGTVPRIRASPASGCATVNGWRVTSQ